MNKRIRVASVYISLNINGGTEKMIATLDNALLGYPVDFFHILLQDIPPIHKVHGKSIILGKKFIPGMGFRKWLFLFFIAKQVKKICIEKNIDVLIGQGDSFNIIIGIAKMLGLRTKSIAYNHTSLQSQSKIVQKIMFFFLNTCDGVIAISKDEKKFLTQHISKPVYFCYNGIDFKNIDIKKDLEVEEQDKIIFEEKNVFTFISVSRPTFQKGLDRLLYAFNDFYKKNKNTQLIIIGDADSQEKNTLYELKSEFSSGKNIHILGKRENIFPYLSKSNTFVLPSRFEGFGLVILEALYCGIPCISTDCKSGPREIIYNEDLLITGDSFSDLEVIDGLHKKMQQVYDKDYTMPSCKFFKQFGLKRFGENIFTILKGISGH